MDDDRHIPLIKPARSTERRAIGPEEIRRLVDKADKEQLRAKSRATAIISASVVAAALAAGLLAHENAIVSALVFFGVCLLSVRLLMMCVR